MAPGLWFSVFLLNIICAKGADKVGKDEHTFHRGLNVLPSSSLRSLPSDEYTKRAKLRHIIESTEASKGDFADTFEHTYPKPFQIARTFAKDYPIKVDASAFNDVTAEELAVALYFFELGRSEAQKSTVAFTLWDIYDDAVKSQVDELMMSATGGGRAVEASEDEVESSDMGERSFPDIMRSVYRDQAFAAVKNAASAVIKETGRYDREWSKNRADWDHFDEIYHPAGLADRQRWANYWGHDFVYEERMPWEGDFIAPADGDYDEVDHGDFDEVDHKVAMALKKAQRSKKLKANKKKKARRSGKGRKGKH